MLYTLGLDLGNTWTIAAINDGQTVTVFNHPSGETAIPSVVALDENRQFLVGQPADRHATSHPSAVAREFKRRFGDTTPLLLRESPVSADELLLRLASHVVETAASQIGDQPSALVVTHPASWGGYKAGLLSDTLERGSLPPHRLVAEPIAIAQHFTADGDLQEGARTAVYDLGGSSFDLTLLELGPNGWDVLGRPGGIDRLGGVDFDTALFRHVLDTADIDLDRWDPDDPATRLSVGGLRDACNSAKHLLSTEAEASVAVSLPGVETTVQVRRTTFESLIEPHLARTLAELDLVVQQQGLTVNDLDEILVAGGSSRIPLVEQRLASHTARPLRLSTDSRFATAFGAVGVVAVVAVVTPTEQPTIAPTVETLGTNFPAVPDMAGEPAPDFLRRTVAVEPALPKPEPAVQPESVWEPKPASAQTQPLHPVPQDRPTQPLPTIAEPSPVPGSRGPAPLGVPEPVTSPRALPHRSPEPVPYSRPKRSKLPSIVAAFVIAATIIGAAIVLQNSRSDETDQVSTTVTTVPASDTTVITIETSTTAVTTRTANFGACTEAQRPKAETAYRVVFIPADDADGGLVGRADPRLDGERVEVFASQSPVKVTGTDCAVDDGGREWWGAITQGEFVWVSAAFLEEL